MCKLNLALATDGEAFDGGAIEKTALGGAETAVIQMARALNNLGHTVQVFCLCPQPGSYQGVVYRDRREIVRAVGEERFDALIVSRFFPILDMPWQAGIRILWNHDILDQPRLLAQRLPGLDACLVLSAYHASNFIQALPALADTLADKLTITRNGLDLSLLARSSQGVTRIEGRVSYVSRPERGLKLLLTRIWPRLLQKMPHLTLSVCGYEIDETALPPALQAEYSQIRDLLISSPKVEYLGALPKAEYYAHLASCQALLYPCVFPEISCLAVLEAQALATPVITSDAFALRESVVVPEFKVQGAPASEAYVENYLTRCQEILNQPARAQELALAAQTTIHRNYDWLSIAGEWTEIILNLRRRQQRRNQLGLCAGLLLSGDRLAAARLYAAPLPALATEKPTPDPDEGGLINNILQSIGPAIVNLKYQGPIAVLEPDPGRTLSALRPFLPEWKLLNLRPYQETEDPCLVLIIRDLLERAPKPHELLRWALRSCHPQGWLFLCVASGAWPLLQPGYLDRQFDLGKEDLLRLLPQRPLYMSYLPRGLVGSGTGRMAIGRWLALTCAEGPPPVPLDEDTRAGYVRPVESQILKEIINAGLL
jgi:glycosyltransferase involved in cell wall biosynthesis